MRGRALTVVATVGVGRGHRGRCRVDQPRRRRPDPRRRTSGRAGRAGLRPRRGRPAARHRDPRRRRLGRPRRRDVDRASSPSSPRSSARPCARPGAEGRELFGFAEHDVTTTYLASSTGLRLRHVQPTARSRSPASPTTGPARPGSVRPTRDFTDIDVPALDAEIAATAWPGRTAGSSWTPGATTRSCRRARSPT